MASDNDGRPREDADEATAASDRQDQPAGLIRGFTARQRYAAIGARD